MVLGSGKIPGHSGTAQKNKRGFEEVRQMNKKQARTKGTGYSNKNYYLPKRSRQYLIWGSAAIALVAVVWFGWMIFDNVTTTIDSKLAQTSRIEQVRQQQINIAKQRNYNSLLRSAESYMKRDYWTWARQEYEQALKIFPNGLEANMGITKALTRLCQEKGLYCTEADQYFQFTLALDDIQAQQILELERWR